MFASSFAAEGINRASAPAVTPDSYAEYAWSTLIRSATTQLVDSCMSKAAASFKPWFVVVETCRLRDQRFRASDASGVLASMLNQHATTQSACTVDSADAVGLQIRTLPYRPKLCEVPARSERARAGGSIRQLRRTFALLQLQPVDRCCEVVGLHSQRRSRLTHG